MVPKEELRSIFFNKFEKPLEDLSNPYLGNFVDAINSWFINFDRDEIDKKDFVDFLYFFEEKCLELVNNSDVKREDLHKVKSMVRDFMDVIEDNTGGNIQKKCEKVSKKILGKDYVRHEVLSDRYRRNVVPKNWVKILGYLLVLVLVVGGGWYLYTNHLDLLRSGFGLIDVGEGLDGGGEGGNSSEEGEGNVSLVGSGGYDGMLVSTFFGRDCFFNEVFV